MSITARFMLRYSLLPITVNTILVLTFWWGWINSSQADGLPFARSGAVGTAVMVAATLWRFGEKLTDERADIMEEFAARLSKMKIRSAGVENAASDLQARLGQRFRLYERRIYFVFGTDLVMSTLVWGFGDILATKSGGTLQLLKSLPFLGGA